MGGGGDKKALHLNIKRVLQIKSLSNPLEPRSVQFLASPTSQGPVL
jgi:hypothetical protein